MSNKKENLFSKVPIFQNLSPAINKKILTVLETVRFAQGEYIFSEGSPGDALYIILKGEVEIVKSLSRRTAKKMPASTESAEKLVATLGANDFFGEMALLDDTVRSAGARTKQPTELLKMSRDKFWDLVKSDVKIALQILLPLAKTLSDRLRQTTLEMATVFELGRIFSTGLSQREYAVQIISQLKPILPEGAFASIAFYNEFNNEFNWTVVSHPDEFPNELHRTVSVNEPIPKILSETRDLFFSPDWKEENRINSEEKKHYGSYEGNVLAAPILRSQETQLLPSGHWVQLYPLIGFIFAASIKKKAVFDKNMLHLLHTVAQLASTALESAAYREEETSRTRHNLARQSAY